LALLRLEPRLTNSCCLRCVASTQLNCRCDSIRRSEYLHLWLSAGAAWPQRRWPLCDNLPGATNHGDVRVLAPTPMHFLRSLMQRAKLAASTLTDDSRLSAIGFLASLRQSGSWDPAHRVQPTGLRNALERWTLQEVRATSAKSLSKAALDSTRRAVAKGAASDLGQGIVRRDPRHAVELWQAAVNLDPLIKSHGWSYCFQAFSEL
jgi:hypothetical protein